MGQALTMNLATIAEFAEFAEVHVVSDLHLGGRPGFQIFGSPAEFAWLIDDLRQRLPASRIGLVINGDFVDFLAQAPALPFDPEGATDKLAGIATDPAFLPVFDALRRFTAADARHLIVNLGNHDLELGLPWVREKLLDILSGAIAPRGADHARLRRRRVLLTVGGARVLCVHGNEVDAWNIADYEKSAPGRDLTRVAARSPRCQWGEPTRERGHEPLSKFSFVDLLKPEPTYSRPCRTRSCRHDQLGKLAPAAAPHVGCVRMATGS
jgi:hypothetical protein